MKVLNLLKLVVIVRTKERFCKHLTVLAEDGIWVSVRPFRYVNESTKKMDKGKGKGCKRIRTDLYLEAIEKENWRMWV